MSYSYEIETNREREGTKIIMAMPTKKQVDSLCEKIKDGKYIYWFDVAIEMGLEAGTMKKALQKYRTDKSQCRESEIYFVESLQVAESNVKNGLYKKASEIDPNFSMNMLSLKDPRYSQKAKDHLRLQGLTFLKSARKVCLCEENKNKSPVEIFEMILADICDKDPSDDIIELNNLLHDIEQGIEE